MDGDVLVFAQVMSVIVPSVAAFVAIFLGARYVWRLGPRQPREIAAFDETRIERIENAVDAIAIEVERISEAQRFTVALLSERLPASPAERITERAVGSKRNVTPH